MNSWKAIWMKAGIKKMQNFCCNTFVPKKCLFFRGKGLWHRHRSLKTKVLLVFGSVLMNLRRVVAKRCRRWLKNISSDRKRRKGDDILSLMKHVIKGKSSYRFCSDLNPRLPRQKLRASQLTSFECLFSRALVPISGRSDWVLQTLMMAQIMQHILLARLHMSTCLGVGIYWTALETENWLSSGALAEQCTYN